MELKPCPFCGGSDIRFTNHGKVSNDRFHFNDDVWSMCCYECGATRPNQYNQHGRQMMVKAWNRRAPACPDGWIAIESGEVPADGVEVLIRARTGWRGEMMTDMGQYEHWRKWWRPRGSNGDFTSRITHWMPLPKAPDSGEPLGTKPDNA